MADNHYKDCYLSLKGSRDAVAAQLCSMFSKVSRGSVHITKEDAEQLIKLLEHYQSMLGDDERFQFNWNRSANGQALILEEQHLYINIRRITIAFLVYLLEERLNIPFGMLLAFAGVTIDGKAFTFLDETRGELCILLETARCGKTGANKNLMQQINTTHECVNNQYTCRYRQDGFCTCMPQNTKDILEHLHHLGALKAKGQKYYYIPDFSLTLL